MSNDNNNKKNIYETSQNIDSFRLGQKRHFIVNNERLSNHSNHICSTIFVSLQQLPNIL